MLAVIASNVAAPAEEAADRDPGILTLAAAVVRAVRRGSAAAFARRCERAREAGFDPAA
ncbi:hypothetical protein [Methylobacterium sp. sgz302541]|uniref:hypothetical protein n=1 Tax=unclassified Methylobacterium TaxID=2615210 RepID=UPI003D341507